MNLQRLMFLYFCIAFMLNLAFVTPNYLPNGQLSNNYTTYQNLQNSSLTAFENANQTLQNPDVGSAINGFLSITGLNFILPGIANSITQIAYLFNMFQIGNVCAQVGFPEPLLSFIYLLNYIGESIAVIYIVAFISGRGLFSLG